MRERVTTLGELAGGALVAVGAGLWSFPLGLVVAGLGLIGVSFLGADPRVDDDQRSPR